MRISKKDALMWFEFFASLPYDQELMPKQTELVYAVLDQIEREVYRQEDELRSQIKGLKSLDGRTYYVGNDAKFSDGCRACLTKNGLNPIRKTNKCNLKCPFCYNFGEMDCQEPIGEGYWEIGGCRFREEDIPMLLKIQGAPPAVSYVYLEPFMEIEKYYGIIKIFKEAGVHQHLYTNGTLATEETIQALGESGLDELRFNLGASECADKVIENIAIAKKYIPRVGIETPMTRSFYEKFHEKKDMILGTGLDFINCAELHLNANNIENYWEENMYMCRHGYISPIISHQLTLKLMKECCDEAWDIAIHDCCDRTKFMRGLNIKSHEGSFFGANDYGMEFDQVPCEAFLNTLNDPEFTFAEEEELPKGYRPGELVF